MKLLILAAGCAALCACNVTIGNAQKNESGPAAAQSDLPRPGLYAVTMTSQIIGNAPPQTIPDENQQACYPPGAMERPDAFFLGDTLSCQRQEFHYANGELSAKMTCNFSDGPEGVPFELHGTYDKEGAELTGDMTFPEGTFRTTRTLKRIGDC